MFCLFLFLKNFGVLPQQERHSIPIKKYVNSFFVKTLNFSLLVHTRIKYAQMIFICIRYDNDR